MNEGHVEQEHQLISDEEAMAATINMRAKLDAGGLKDVNRQTMIGIADRLIGLVKEGQPCEARFYGIPDKVFSAHVEELGSVLSSERRTMRVL